MIGLYNIYCTVYTGLFYTGLFYTGLFYAGLFYTGLNSEQISVLF